jgi:PKD repeat protein
MNLHDAKGEGFRCTIGKDIYYYNNIGANLQHTCVMYSRVTGGEIHDNVVHQCSCAADRLDNCQNIEIYNEKISPYSGVTTYIKDSMGYAVSDLGIQICNIASSPATLNIIVHDCNIMSGVNGILLDSLNDGSNVNLYNNVIHDSGYEHEAVSRNGGIGITRCGNGITIQNNDITGSDVAGINVNSAISGTHKVTVANNDIMNGKTGYAVKNSVSLQISLTLTHNYISGNPASFYPTSLVNTNQATSQNSKLEFLSSPAQDETVTANPVPVAVFSASPTSGVAPLKVQFTDKSSNSPKAWNWNFGDGTANSTVKNPIHSYLKAGSYTVVLTASNAAGSNTITKSKYITVVIKPVASFSVSTASGKAPLTVKFTDKSTGSPASWSWDFGDKSTSTTRSPSHKYTKAGKYTVTLTVKNAAGGSSVKKTNCIIVK